MTPPTGAERRRFPRIPMSLKAILQGGELADQACVIRDFCPGGLFLSWPDDSDLDVIESTQDYKDQVFSLAFQVRAKNGKVLKSKIDIKVVRQYHGGLGVAFVNPDKKAMVLLHKIAQLSQDKLNAEKEKDTEQLRKSQSTDKKSQNKTTNDRSQLRQTLLGILQTYFSDLKDLFQIKSKEPGDETEKFAYFNALESLNNHTESISSVLINAIEGQLNSVQPQSWEKTLDEETAEPGQSLSLVDEKEFESYLALNGVISETEADHRILLFQLTNRVSQIYRTKFDQSTNPVGVSRLCRTIDDYLQHIEFEPFALNQSYELMGKALVPGLISFYQEFAGDEELVNAPDEDAFKPVHQQRANAHLQAGASQEANLHAPTNDTMQSRVPSQGFGQAQPGHGYVGNVGPQSQQSGSQYSAQHPSHHPITGQIHNVAESLLGMRENLVPATNTQQVSQAGGFPAFDSDMMSGGIDAGRTVSAQELLQIMSSLQQEDQQNIASEATIYDFNDRFGELLTNQNLRITPQHQQAVSLAGNMLNFFKEDEHLSNVGRQDLHRLQSLLYKQAVSEQGLTSSEANPLREIINSLDQLDRYGANHSQSVRPQITDLMHEVMRVDELPEDAINRLHDEFHELVESQKQTHQEKLDELARQCDLEETFIADHRRTNKKEISASGKQLLSNPEWMVWQNKAESMIKGDGLLVDNGKGDKERLTLAWKDKSGEDFVFADNDGNKAAKLTLRELAVRLLKGSAELEETRQHSLFDQAVVSGLFNAFDEIKKSTETDKELDIWNADKFTSYLSDLCESAASDFSEHAVIYIDVSGHEFEGEQEIAYLNHLIEKIKENHSEVQSISYFNEKNALVFALEFENAEGTLIHAEMLLKEFEDNPYVEAENDYPIDVALGVSFVSQASQNAEDVIRQATEAALESRQQGSNFATLYQSQEVASNENSFDWDMWLEDYAEVGERPPLYSQIYLSSKGRAEKAIKHIFVAREDDNGKVILPDRFLNACKDKKQLIAFEKNYISLAMDWLRENKKAIRKVEVCLINLSYEAVNHKSLLDLVLEEFNTGAIIPGKVCFSIPANSLKKENKNAKRFVRTLREFGCKFCLNNFGHDAAGQEAIKQPAEYVGIDTDLIKKVQHDATALNMIKSVNDIAHMMDKQSLVPMSLSDDLKNELESISFDYISSDEEADIQSLVMEDTEVLA